MIDIHVEARETKLRDELTSFFTGLGPAVDIDKRAQEESVAYVRRGSRARNARRYNTADISPERHKAPETAARKT